MDMTLTASDDLEILVRRLKRRLLTERVMFFLLLGAAGAAWGYPVLFPTVWAVTVDGRPVLALRDRDSAVSVVERLRESAAGSEAESALAVRLGVKPADPAAVALCPEKQAVGRVAQAVGLGEERAVIRCQGAAVAALPTEQEAEAALSALKTRFVQQGQDLESEPEFKEKVVVRREMAPPALWCKNSADAAQRLLNGRTDEESVHVVAEGETPETVASQYGLDLRDLQEMNPGIAVSTLRPRAAVRVRRPETPTVTVVTRHRLAEQRPIPFTTTKQPDRSLYVGKSRVIAAGAPGREQVSWLIRSENGREVTRELASRTVLAQPKAGVIATGSLPRPSKRR